MTTPVGLSATAPARLAWIDTARGIGILLVVFGHAERGVMLHDPARAPGWAIVTDQLVYSFHMPLFFLLSGLFAWQSLAKGRGGFVADKLRYVAYPYVLWSLIVGGIEVAAASHANTPLTVRDVLRIPVQPIEQFWFLYALFLCHLVALACFPRKAVLVVAAIVALAVSAAMGPVTIVLAAMKHLPFYAIGIVAAAPILLCGARRTSAGPALAAAAAIYVLAHALDMPALAPVLALAGSAVVMAGAALLDGLPARALAVLGRGSEAIFVMHTLFSAGTRIVGSALGFGAWPVALLAAVTLAGVAGPLAIWWLAERRSLCGVLGFGKSSRRALPPPVTP